MTKSLFRKSAAGAEIFERNPFLSKHWFTRFLAAPILMGAQLNKKDAKLFKFFILSGPAYIYLFSIDLFSGVQISTGGWIWRLILTVFFSAGYPAIVAANYGYIIRDKIDTGGSLFMFKADFSRIWRQYGFAGAAMAWIINKIFR